MYPSTKTARLLSSANSDNAAVAFDSPSVLNSIVGLNNRAGVTYLKLYALGTNLAPPTNASIPLMTIPLPASAAFAIDLGKGLKVNSGLGYRIVTGSADNDATAVAAGDVLGLNFLAGH